MSRDDDHEDEEPRVLSTIEKWEMMEAERKEKLRKELEAATYEDLVSYVGRELESDNVRLQPDEVRRQPLRNAIRLDVRIGTPTNYIERSASDAVVFDELLRAIGERLKENQPLRPELNVWLGKYLTDEISKPPGKRGRLSETSRNELICSLICDLASCTERYATRNQETEFTPESASICDIIAEAIDRVLPNDRQRPKYDQIKDIWEARDREIYILDE